MSLARFRLLPSLRLAPVFAAAAALASAFAGCAGNDDYSPDPPAYSLMLRKGALYDLHGPTKQAGFDKTRNAWWLVGNGVTVQLTPLRAAAAAPGPVVLHLRTTADPAVDSQVSLLRVVTPDFRIDAPSRTPGSIHISRNDTPGSVQSIRDSDDIRITRAGTRVKVVLSARFLRHYAPHGAAVTWFDTSPAALPDQAYAPAPAPEPSDASGTNAAPPAPSAPTPAVVPAPAPSAPAPAVAPAKA